MITFLTGRSQVGKSTIIKNLLKTSSAKIGGFKTKWMPVEDGKVLVLLPYSTPDESYTEKNIAARDCFSEKSRTVYPEVFDVLGPQILKDSSDCDYIIMDELGYMESRSLAFQKAVQSILDSGKEILGVLQPKPFPFLDSVRARDDVSLITVDIENREEVFIKLLNDKIIK